MKIKKITEQVELNVAGQGCLDDCKSNARWRMKDAATNAALAPFKPCYKQNTAKKCLFW